MLAENSQVAYIKFQKGYEMSFSYNIFYWWQADQCRICSSSACNCKYDVNKFRGIKQGLTKLLLVAEKVYLPKISQIIQNGTF